MLLLALGLPFAATAQPIAVHDLAVLVEGDKRLFNQYGVMLVNPAKHPHVKAADGQKFVDWLVSAPGQATIASYKIGGEQLFFPNAEK